MLYICADRYGSREARDETALHKWRVLQQLLRENTRAKDRPEVVVDELHTESWNQQDLLDAQLLAELEHRLLCLGLAAGRVSLVEVTVNADVGEPVVDVSAGDGRDSPLARCHSVHSRRLC